MEIRIQSDGQLYGQKSPPKELPPKPPPPPACPSPAPKSEGAEWEELLLIAVGFMVLKGGERADIPLLLALAYILFDSCFSLKKLL